MSQSDLAKNIFKEILNIFSICIDKTGKTLKFSSQILREINSSLKKTFPEINFYEKKENTSFEALHLYKSFIVKLRNYILRKEDIYIDSLYLILYFQRIINYLKELIELNINIIEDDLVKIFFYLLFLFLDSQFTKENPKDETYDLDETFFKGTFIELNEKYRTKIHYKDSKEIKNFIDDNKKLMIENILTSINESFQEIYDILKEKGKKTDNLIIKMTTDVSSILREHDKSNGELTTDLINKIKIFFSKEEYLILSNYFAEIEYGQLNTNIDKDFYEKIKHAYSPVVFNYNYIDDDTTKIAHEENLENYINQRNQYYIRMKYSSLNEILRYNLEDEINIFALSKYYISTDFKRIQNFKKRLENLNQKKIIQIIKDILNENDFYEHYFSILKTDVIKTFFYK